MKSKNRLVHEEVWGGLEVEVRKSIEKCYRLAWQITCALFLHCTVWPLYSKEEATRRSVAKWRMDSKIIFIDLAAVVVWRLTVGPGSRHLRCVSGMGQSD